VVLQAAHRSGGVQGRSDVWTKIAADPIAFEPPSAGFALDWRTQLVWRQRGISFSTLTHAAGISSTGDQVLDLRLPFDEPYCIPEHTASAINHVKSQGGRIVAVGTTVVRALESAANADGSVRFGDGVARGRIACNTAIRVVDAILTGVHRPGESHFELLGAFTDGAVLAEISEALVKHGYRPHEFGDSMLIERRASMARPCSNTEPNLRHRCSDTYWGYATKNVPSESASVAPTNWATEGRAGIGSKRAMSGIRREKFRDGIRSVAAFCQESARSRSRVE
jgi:Queuosine biosynthesis protein